MPFRPGGDPGKRCAFCLFVSNYGDTMSIPMDPPYCLVYPMSYMRDVEPDHFDTHNNLARTHLCHCICRTTLQYMNDDPSQHREYAGSHLILPHGAQYKERLFPEILEPRNHWAPLTDSVTKEPFPMELVGDSGQRTQSSKGVMVTHSCTLTQTWADSGGMGYTFLHTGVKSWHHQRLPTCKPSSPRP